MTLKTAIRWAVHPADQNRITQLPGIGQHVATSIPNEGETIIHPYLVDPQTHQPCPVIVSQVMRNYTPDYLVIVVSRLQ